MIATQQSVHIVFDCSHLLVVWNFWQMQRNLMCWQNKGILTCNSHVIMSHRTVLSYLPTSIFSVSSQRTACIQHACLKFVQINTPHLVIHQSKIFLLPTDLSCQAKLFHCDCGELITETWSGLRQSIMWCGNPKLPFKDTKQKVLRKWIRWRYTAETLQIQNLNGKV